MSSLRRHEGYLLIDNRFGPGVTEEFVRASGQDTPVVPEGRMYESATITCSHCQQVLVVNPQRTRSRGYCPKCDHYICDTCEGVRVKTGECRPYKQILDEMQEQAFRAEQSGIITLK